MHHEVAPGLCSLASVLGPLPVRRALVVVAHPDDETIGAAGLLQRAEGAGVVHLTDGAPRNATLRPAGRGLEREQYAAIRRGEAYQALAHVGVPAERIHWLGAVDQEASLQLEPLTLRLAALIDELRPSMLVTQPYEGGHPDHDSAAFVARAALRLLARAGRRPPALVEMTAYHGHGGGLTTGEFLPGSGPPAAAMELNGEERARKRRMLECFGSQRDVLLPFGVDVEKFRTAPAYDFSQPPHPGPLHYERMGWPISGERFRQLATAALRTLALPVESPC